MESMPLKSEKYLIEVGRNEARPIPDTWFIVSRYVQSHSIRWSLSELPPKHEKSKEIPYARGEETSSRTCPTSRDVGSGVQQGLLVVLI
jgi:hypothetical protein